MVAVRRSLVALIAVLVVAVAATACAPGSTPHVLSCASTTGRVSVRSNTGTGGIFDGGPLTLQGCSGITSITEGRFDITLPWSAADPSPGHVTLTFDGAISWSDSTTSTARLALSFDESTGTPVACPPSPTLGWVVSGCKRVPLAGSWSITAGRFLNSHPSTVSGSMITYAVESPGNPAASMVFLLQLGPVLFVDA